VSLHYSAVRFLLGGFVGALSGWEVRGREHVPPTGAVIVAFVYYDALTGFIVAGVFAILHLRSGASKYDARSYVAIHISVIFGVAVLLTGAIWARASWGKWWVWQEPTLVSFLIAPNVIVTVPTGHVGEVDRFGNLLLRRES